MSSTTIAVTINDLLLSPLQRYAAARDLRLDFVLAVAIDQFLSDPANQAMGRTS